MEQEARSAPLILLAGLGLAVLVSCGATAEPGSVGVDPVRGEVSTTAVSTLPESGTTGAPVVDTTEPAPPNPTTGSVPEVDGLLALDVLSTINVAREMPTGYDRELFGGWIDADGDGCNTREEVLIAESVGAAQIDPYGCAVVAGEWFSAYDGVTWTDPSDVDIDHVVALKEAWDSGAHGWSAAERRRFANDLGDPRPLRAVTDNVNQSKGDADPSNWLPARDRFVCTYVSDWIAIKAHWGLSMDESEFGRLRNLLQGPCAGTTISAWG